MIGALKEAESKTFAQVMYKGNKHIAVSTA